jgi:hypothetical protein
MLPVALRNRAESKIDRRRAVSRGVLVIGAVAVLAGALGLCALQTVWAGDAPAAAAPTAAAPAAGGDVDYTKISPVDLVAKAPKGSLHNPYKDTQDDVTAAGGKFLLSYSCSGCHGGNGGGGMCPPLTNDTWVYGGDDDTLFRLITLGSDELQKAGYMRKGHENVVGPMPPFGTIIKSPDDL